jgi:hypothetical protein
VDLNETITRPEVASKGLETSGMPEYAMSEVGDETLLPPPRTPVTVSRVYAAHAALDGSERELGRSDYKDLIDEVRLFLSALLDCIISERARRIWEPRARR